MGIMEREKLFIAAKSACLYTVNNKWKAAPGGIVQQKNDSVPFMKKRQTNKNSVFALDVYPRFIITGLGDRHRGILQINDETVVRLFKTHIRTRM